MWDTAVVLQMFALMCAGYAKRCTKNAVLTTKPSKDRCKRLIYKYWETGNFNCFGYHIGCLKWCLEFNTKQRSCVGMNTIQLHLTTF